MDNILELHQVCKTFPKTNFTLDHVSFSIPYGSIMGFVGENGAGKTTTIGCVLNTVSKDSDVMQGLYANWDNDLFKKYLNDFRLLPNQKIKSYSRGMTMKLAVAAALSHHPQLLILDEATSGLDPIMRDDMLDVFLEFVQDENHSILLSSHITSDLEKIADYITFIHNGKLIMAASKNDLVYNFAVMRCKESQFLELDPGDILVYRKRDYQIDVLVSNGNEIQRKYRNAVIDHVSVDEIMLLLVKGERV